MKKLFLICSMTIYFIGMSQVPNGGFENWATDSSGALNPVGWTSSNDGTDISVSKTQPAYSGAFAARVATWDPGFKAIPGMLSIDFPFASRPVKFRACYKTKVQNSDIIYLFFSASKMDQPIVSTANCTFKLLITDSNWKCNDFPLQYISADLPDTANITIIAGDFLNAVLGTEITLDELSFGFSSSAGEVFIPLSEFLPKAYPNPADQIIHIPLVLNENADIRVQVIDGLGREVIRTSAENMQAGNQIVDVDIRQLPAGVYTFLILVGEKLYAETLKVVH